MKGQSAGNTNQIIIGSAAEIADHENVKMPTWDRRGRTQFYDVDHAQELQLGGLDAWDNFWLLDQSSNRSSGSKIASELRKKINAILTSSQSADFWTSDNQGRKPSYNDDIKAGSGAWTVEFATFSQLEISGNDRYWTRSEIQAGDHLVHLRAMTEREIVAEGLVYAGPGGTPSHISIFTSDFGGYRRRMNLTAGVATPDRRAGGTGFYKGFDLTEDMAYTAPPTGAGGEVIGVLRGTMFRKENSEGEVFDPQPTTLNVINKPQFGYGGHVDTLQLRRAILAMTPNASALSPMGFTDAGLNNQGEIYANGMITATKALFPGLEIPISVLGNDIFITFPVPTDKLSFGPVSVPEASISLGVGDNGVFLSGFAAIEVASVGSGMLEARVEEGNTIISGDFNFDLDFLDPATASASYNFNTDEFTLSLTAGVQEGRIPGIESGEVTATFTRETIAISGSLVAGGMLSGTVVSVSYSPEEGLSLGADNIPLPIDRIPGVTSATASLYARQNPETREWSFGGTGSATLGIAGATGSITVGVDGDKVTFGGNLTVAKGPASGSISFTATNAPMDEDGNITEGDALEEYTIFGRGSAEITFGSVLKGSAAIELSPDASITISGTIGLPPTFEVFPKQEYNKSLLKVETPDFPIWGVSVGGVGIGIFAFADAELSFNAFVGPGQLVDTQITATMDLDAPEDAVITGSARFTVPAYAGFNLDIGGGLRARATVAFVEGRVGLDGELGIEADASAGVDVNWNRTDGLTVDAEVEANARPKFRVGVNASVTAGVDLLLTEVSHTWGPWRKTLGEFGPDMEMGVTIPVSWNENTGVDFSLDDIVIRKPEFNTKDILKSSFEELV
jgi:hypothetical protein